MNNFESFLLGFLVTIILCVILVTTGPGKVLQQDAVDLNHAIYHPTSGEFTWLEHEKENDNE